MGDHYGPLALPAPAPEPDEAIADPLIDVVLGFYAAVLNFWGGAAWSAVNGYQGGDDRLVVSVNAFEPDETTFNTTDLPALFLWRDEVGGADWIAQDYYVRTSKLIMLWVPPPAEQATRAKWKPIINLIASSLDGITDPSARIPTWKRPGDTDPLAAYQGSLLWKYLPFVYEFDIRKTKQVPVTIKMADGSPDESYFAIRTEIHLREMADTDEPQVRGFPLRSAIVTSIQNRGLDILPEVDLGLNLRSLTPSSGPGSGGTSVTIFGTGVDDEPTVLFGGVASPSVSVNANAVITAMSPPAIVAGTVDVVVTNANDDESTLAASFTYF